LDTPKAEIKNSNKGGKGLFAKEKIFVVKKLLFGEVNILIKREPMSKKGRETSYAVEY